FLLQLERESVPATEELRGEFEEVAKTAPPKWSPPAVEMIGNMAQAPLFPSFRNPEQLYRGYLSVVNFSDNEARAAILGDLALLPLPDGLDESTFRERVGAELLTLRTVAAFDEFVGQPRFFGEMAEWLKAHGILADKTPDDRKRYLQTLIRWLRQ